MAKAEDLVAVLSRRAKFEPVDVEEKPTQIRILGRVRTDSSVNAATWLGMMDAIAQREEREGVTWKIDISRKYFRRNGVLVFAWRLIIQGPDLENQLNDIIQAAMQIPQARGETMEIGLHGSSADRNAIKNGKGAGATGKVLAGPAAIQAHRQSGGG